MLIKDCPEHLDMSRVITFFRFLGHNSIVELRAHMGAARRYLTEAIEGEAQRKTG